MENYVAQLGLTYPVLMDPNAEVHREYAQQMAFPSAAYPQDWVIGTGGTVIYMNNGFELDAMISAIQGELD